MFIVRHKTRRKPGRPHAFDSGFYFVVNGVHSVGTAEEAADIAIDVFGDEVKMSRKAATLWDIYRSHKNACYTSI